MVAPIADSLDQSERHQDVELWIERVFVAPTSHAQMSQESVTESHLLDVLFERRRGAVAIEEDRQAIRVVKAQRAEVHAGSPRPASPKSRNTVPRPPGQWRST